jgi:hypothetical protein
MVMNVLHVSSKRIDDHEEDICYFNTLYCKQIFTTYTPYLSTIHVKDWNFDLYIESRFLCNTSMNYFQKSTKNATVKAHRCIFLFFAHP